MTATRAMCVGPEDVEFVMGGVAQAIAVDAAELATANPCCGARFNSTLQHEITSRLIST